MPFAQETRQKIADLGEFGLIEAIKRWCPPPRSRGLLTGIGDDAAHWQPKAGYQQLFCGDMLMEGIHFDLKYCPLQDLGYKALVANISDICAMNGTPTYAVVNLGISSRFDVEDLRLLYKGMQQACHHYECSIVGGDTVASQVGLTVSVSMLGEVLPAQVAHRQGARPGDYLCVSGELGAAYIGLRLLQDSQNSQKSLQKHENQPDLSQYEHVIKRYLRPEARNDLRNLFDRQSIQPTAMIDLSDGLATATLQLCTASEVGVLLEGNALPISSDTLLAIKYLQDSDQTGFEAACYGGEDYELLFTLAPRDYERVARAEEISCIGRVKEAEKGAFFTHNGKKMSLKHGGWSHFAASNPG